MVGCGGIQVNSGPPSELSHTLRNADALVIGGVMLIGIGSEWREEFHPAVSVLLPVVGATTVLVGWILLRRIVSRLVKEIAELKK